MSDPFLEASFKRFFPLIREKSRRVLGGAPEAEDVAQETFIRFWQARATLPANLGEQSAWLYRVGTRLALDALRRRAVRARTTPVEPATHSGSDELVDLRSLLATLIDEAPAEEIEFVVLSRVDGLTHEEIAQTCKVSERTVRRGLARFDTRAEALRAQR